MVRKVIERGSALTRSFWREPDTPMRVLFKANESIRLHRPKALASLWQHEPTGSLSSVDGQKLVISGVPKEKGRREVCFPKESPTARSGVKPLSERCRSVAGATVYDKRITRHVKPVVTRKLPDHRAEVMAVRSNLKVSIARHEACSKLALTRCGKDNTVLASFQRALSEQHQPSKARAVWPPVGCFKNPVSIVLFLSPALKCSCLNHQVKP